MGTISEETARELADLHHSLGQQFVSAPLLCNPQLADPRHLLVFAAADSATLDRCVPLLECVGRRVVVIGEHAEEANRIQIAFGQLPEGASWQAARSCSLRRPCNCLSNARTERPAQSGWFEGLASHSFKAPDQAPSPCDLVTSFALSPERWMHVRGGLRGHRPCAGTFGLATCRMVEVDLGACQFLASFVSPSNPSIWGSFLAHLSIVRHGFSGPPRSSCAKHVSNQ